MSDKTLIKHSVIKGVSYMIPKRLRDSFVASFGGVLLSAILIFSLATLSADGQAKAPDATTLDIFSQWSSGRDLDALNALVGVYTSTFTNTSVTVSYD